MKTVNETYEATKNIIHSKSGAIIIKTTCCESSIGLPECIPYFEIINKVPFLVEPPIATITINIDRNFANVQDNGEYFIYETAIAADNVEPNGFSDAIEWECDKLTGKPALFTELDTSENRLIIKMKKSEIINQNYTSNFHVKFRLYDEMAKKHSKIVNSYSIKVDV